MEEPLILENDASIQNLKCNICFDVTKRCHSCQYEHKFCAMCIRRWCRHLQASDIREPAGVRFVVTDRNVRTLMLVLEVGCAELRPLVLEYGPASSVLYSETCAFLQRVKYSSRIAKKAMSSREQRFTATLESPDYFKVYLELVERSAEHAAETYQAAITMSQISQKLEEFGMSLPHGVQFAKDSVISVLVDKLSDEIKQLSCDTQHMAEDEQKDLEIVLSSSKDLKSKLSAIATQLKTTENFELALTFDRELKEKFVTDIEKTVTVAYTCHNATYRVLQHSNFFDTTFLALEELKDGYSSYQCYGSCPVCRTQSFFIPAPDIDRQVAEISVGCPMLNAEGSRCSWAGKFLEYREHDHRFQKRMNEGDTDGMESDHRQKKFEQENGEH